MDRRSIEKLATLGAIATTSGGKEGVRVSLQDTRRFDDPSRHARRASLRETFERVNAQIQDVDIDLESLSVSGQTVVAVLPTDRFEDIEQELKRQEIRVDLDITRNAV